VADFTGTYELGPSAGRVLVKTGRAGLAAKVGHDLTMEITQWSARVTVPDGGVGAATLTADLDLGSLAVREGTGGAKPLTDKDRRDILNSATKILGASATAGFASTGVLPAPGGGAIEGTLTLRGGAWGGGRGSQQGTSRPLRIQVISPAQGHYRGTAVVRQSDFGITPYSGFFGALKLRDEVTVEFEVQFAP
jgi:polyisoprenoid-binding protein YceI